MMNKHSAKHSKIDLYKKIMPVTWYPTRWWDLQLLNIRTKKLNQFLLIELGSGRR